MDVHTYKKVAESFADGVLKLWSKIVKANV